MRARFCISSGNSTCVAFAFVHVSQNSGFEVASSAMPSIKPSLTACVRATLLF
jgi:hypothetical protein